MKKLTKSSDIIKIFEKLSKFDLKICEVVQIQVLFTFAITKLQLMTINEKIYKTQTEQIEMYVSTRK